MKALAKERVLPFIALRRVNFATYYSRLVLCRHPKKHFCCRAVDKIAAGAIIGQYTGEVGCFVTSGVQEYSKAFKGIFRSAPEAFWTFLHVPEHHRTFTNFFRIRDV